MDQDLIKIYGIILISIIFLVAALPLKNYLEIKQIQKKDDLWMRWVRELPSKEDYLQRNHSSGGYIQCNYCDATKQYPSLEMVIQHRPTFGVVNNKFSKYAYFKAYICMKCGTQLFRERYEE